MKNFRIKSSDEIKASVCCATTGRFLAQLYDSGFSTIRGVQYSLLTKIPHTSAKELRYGKILILTDADHDGSHIKGLIFNALHYLCPSLVNIAGIFTAMITPILKIKKGTKMVSFYTQSDFDDPLINTSRDISSSTPEWF